MKNPLKFLVFVGENVKELASTFESVEQNEWMFFTNLEELKSWLFLRVLDEKSLPQSSKWKTGK